VISIRKSNKRASTVLIIILTILVSMIAGGLVVNYSIAASGQLSAQGDSWETGDASGTVICKKTGRYRIDVTGGGWAAGDYYYSNLSAVYGSSFGFNNNVSVNQKMGTLNSNVCGGNLSGEIQLNKGDSIEVIKYESAIPLQDIVNGKGISLPLLRGGSAMLVIVNGTPIIGAGGCSSIKNSNVRADWDTGAFQDSTGYINTGYNAALPVTGIDNSRVFTRFFV